MGKSKGSSVSSVAIIGAGAAGLVTAAEMLRAGFEVTVLEQGQQPGGLWCYAPETEDDPLGLNPTSRIYSSLYDSLHTNLPRDLMAFWNYSFDSDGGGADDWPRYPHHTQVLKYLQNFCRDHKLSPHIHLGTQITAAHPVQGCWDLTCDGEVSSLQVDALVVCNGHYSEPKIVQIAGMQDFQGEIIHAHNYRRPDSYKGLKIAVFGTAASGFDLALELGPLASELHWLGHDEPSQAIQLPGVTCGGMPSHFLARDLVLASGETVSELDLFIFATGYRYDLPFLHNQVPVQDNRVGPLYYDMIYPTLPTLGFVGLPYLVIPFPLFQIQARWLARWFQSNSNQVSAENMQTWIEQDLKSKGDRPARQHHRLAEQQFRYMNQLLADIGDPPIPEWFTELARLSQEARLKDPVGFRQAKLPVLGPTRVTL